MKSLLPVALTLLLAPVAAPQLRADDEGPGADAENRFVLTGYGYTKFLDPEGSDGSFSMGFAPIFLYRVSDKLLFEAELEFEFEDDVLETGLEYAQIDWLASDTVTVIAGKYLTPFGSFIEKMHPAWINKLPTFPLLYEHGRSVIPFGQTGLQLRGAVPLADGYRRLTYAVFLSNGIEKSAHGDAPAEEPVPHEDPPPMSEMSARNPADEPESEAPDGHSEEDEPIFLAGASANTNGNLGYGGRISFVPARGFELGASYITGRYDEHGKLASTATGVEFTYHHDLFDIRAEWVDSVTQRGLAPDGDPLDDQKVKAWYLQPSLRLSVLPAYVFNRVELVARLAHLDRVMADEDQTSVGLNYYLTDSSALRVAWERLEGSDQATADAVNVMLALGF